MLLALAFATFSLPEINAAYFPFGRPDLDITLGKPSFEPIYLGPETFDLLLDDMDKIPMLVKDTMLPTIRETFLKNEHILVNEYVEYISATYNMKENMMQIEIILEPDDFPDQIVKVEPTAEGRMSIINHVTISISVYRNSIAPDWLRDTLNKIEDLNSARTQVLATYVRESLQEHKEKLLADKIEDGPSSDAAIGFILLKMLDRDVARVTVFYPVDENGNSTKAIDEIKTGIHIVPEFPSTLIAITAVGLIGALVALRVKSNSISARV